MNIALCCWLLLMAPTGEEVLKRIDEQMQKTKSQILTLEMVIEDKAHEPRRLGMQMYMRGEQRRIAFLYPGDMKGMRVLNLSAAQTYVYLPAFRKVRRVASHMKDQTLFGSDYTFDDFSTLSLQKNYTGDIVAENDDTWTLRATPRAGGDSPYSRLELMVSKKVSMPVELRFFDATGQKIRTETREDYQCSSESCLPRKTKMVDHRHEDHWTEVSIKDLQVNVAFSDQIFSLRDLQRND